MERGIVMKKIEATSSHVLNETGVSKENAVTMIEDLKALVKIGIINSNLITVFTEFWLALHSTKKFFANWDIFIITMPGSALVIAEGCILRDGMM